MYKVTHKILHENKLPHWVWLFWLLQNILSRIGGWMISAIRPITEREQMIPAWPPQPPFLSWFERIWSAPLERWDTVYYMLISSAGYSSENGSVQFHPLYPLLATPLTHLGLPPLLSLLFVSTIASLATLWLMYQLARIDLGINQAVTSVLFLYCSPFAFALFIPYSESLFILCAILSLYYGRKNQWWLAGISAALATLTRQQGIFLVLPLAWEYWESSNYSLPEFLNYFRLRTDGTILSAPGRVPYKLPRGLALILAPAAYALWIAYRAFAVNDVSFDFSSLNNFVYSLLISPYAIKVVPVQQFLFPWQTLWLAGRKLFLEPDPDIISNIIWGIYYIILLSLSWKYLRKSYRIYCIATTIISFSYYTGTLHPYMGLIRHLLLGFPVFIGLAVKVKSSISRIALTTIGLLGYFHLSLFYSLHVWVP